MRKAIIAGNWKMNKTPSEAVALINELKPLVANEEVDVVFNFYSLAESNNSEYAYVLSGLKDLTVITVYSNNDNYIDYVEGSKVTTKGVVNKVRYSENYDEIKTIEIVEK